MKLFSLSNARVNINTLQYLPHEIVQLWSLSIVCVCSFFLRYAIRILYSVVFYAYSVYTLRCIGECCLQLYCSSLCYESFFNFFFFVLFELFLSLHSLDVHIYVYSHYNRSLNCEAIVHTCTHSRLHQTLNINFMAWKWQPKYIQLICVPLSVCICVVNKS